LVRANNEDHYLAVRFGRTLEVVSSKVPEDLVPPRTEERGYGLLVADGVGPPDWPLRAGDREAETVMERMAQRYVDASLAETAREDAELAGMGTTMTLVCSLGTQMILAGTGPRVLKYSGVSFGGRRWPGASPERVVILASCQGMATRLAGGESRRATVSKWRKWKSRGRVAFPRVN